MVRIGVNPIVWSNDDDHALGSDISVQRCLSEARAAGYSGIELGHKLPRDPQSLKALLGAAHLDLVSGWWGARLLERSLQAEIEALQPHLNLLLAMGCDVLVLAEVTGAVHSIEGVHWGQRTVLHPSTLKGLAENLTSLAEHCLQSGLQVAYHHHVGTVIQSAADIHDLMKASGHALGLLLDTGHAVVGGVSPLELLQEHGHRIHHVHLKDVRAGPLQTAELKRSSFLDAVRAGMFTVPGDGMIAWDPIFAALKGVDYTKWLVVEAEQDPMQAEPARYARMGYRFVRDQVQSVSL